MYICNCIISFSKLLLKTKLLIMNKHVMSIKKYYTNIQYENEDKILESLVHIHYLSVDYFLSLNSFEEIDDLAHRFLNIASLMEKNLNYFMSVCEHVDIVLNILDYLYYYGAIFMLESETENNNLYLIRCILLTIYYMYQDNVISTFLESFITGQELKLYYDYKNVLHTYLQVEIIVCEDSDLHAVITYLKLNSAVSCLKKIWVQKSIKDTFMWHLNKNVGYLNVPIKIFQLKQELITPNNEYIFNETCKLNVVSIWSENITAAKNLARSLNQHIAFINTYMDVCRNVVIPFEDIFRAQFTFGSLFLHRKMDKCTKAPINPTAHEGLTYNLFYNDMWQKPKQNTYWIHENILFANATREDIIECVKSATRGFKNLSTMSDNSKRQMLSKFATILECNDEFELSKAVSKWLNMSYVYGKMSFYNKTEKFETLRVFRSKIVILKEKDGITLFQELTQNLIIGNSVIVICNPDLCILAPYCNMFKMCGIPSGTINLLSIKNTEYINNSPNLLISTLSQAIAAFTVVQHILICHN
ncbi:uncharacterized protein LOC114944571 [Nylanderia fulva]|uniref:uncharacterized protein LOC114944571 n=1 Tax=Nylanderia fulva TaxID=613905 RepID=UPI0010FBA2CA|nr:uncharacterized protein LOC114944571 [Nylanderia fulva]